jgi:epoxyqueuosine reductase
VAPPAHPSPDRAGASTGLPVGFQDEVLAAGRAAGLDAAGIAPAVRFDRARAAIEARLADGLDGGLPFTFRKPARSTDPSGLLPGAAALVVGATSYLRADPVGHPDHHPGPSPEGPASGRIARYQWRDHYEPLRAGLAAVATVLRQAGWRTRVLADDNSLVDREAAALAGLGWYGKNCCILLPGRGSWFVLGSVLTDAPLAPTGTPAADGCGSCSACLPACPTGALVAPGVLDARRCLAWLVQAPGDFPEAHREALGDRIYGCDDCQEVCPVNRRAARAHPPPAAEPDSRPWVELVRLATATGAEVLAAHGRWYLPDRDPDVLRRNAFVALGNVGDPAAAEVRAAVAAGLADPNPMIVRHAAWAADRLDRRRRAGTDAGTDPGTDPGTDAGTDPR